MSSKEHDIAHCPHCGNRTQQNLEGQFTSLHRADGSHTYFLTRCSTCYEGLLYLHVDSNNGIPTTGYGHFKLGKYRLVWPPKKDLHSSIPEEVRRIYREALLVKPLAPNAFANQIRRALEAVCKDRGEIKGDLYHRLKALAAKNEIPPTLSDMTTVLRKLGNDGSHANDEDVSADMVDVIDDFFTAIIEYVYIGPFKIAEFKAKLATLPKTSPEMRNVK